MKLLVIRPGPGADATAARVEAAGHQALVIPLFGVEPVAWNAPSAQGFDGVLLTSSNAVRNCGPQLSTFAHLPVYAVGKVTAEAAKKHGLCVTKTGDAGAEAVLAGLGDCRLLWLAGEDHTEIVVPMSVQMDTHIVYRSAILPVPANFIETTMQADHVMLHSARAAAHFASLVSGAGLDKAAICLAALSEKIAMAAGGGWKSVRAAAHPNDAALLSCL
jgi:uroporphyrinogen-III synthase